MFLFNKIRNTLIECDAENLGIIGPSAMKLAEEEGLDAHKNSIGIRLKNDDAE